MDNEPANIWVAASDGSVDRIRSLIAEGVSINAQDEHGYSPIHAAVSYGHADLIEFLLSSGADLNLRDIDGDTPLLVCEEPEIFELLIQHGANAEDVNSEGEGILEKALQDENENLIAFLIVNQYISNDEVQNMIKNNTVDQTAEQLCGIDEEDEEDESHKSID